jgi:hypothetical protein
MDFFPHHNRPCHCMFSTFIKCRPYTLLQKQFVNLKWCRSHNKVCSVLETIKAFGWICWGLLTILLIVTLIKLVLNGTGSSGGRTNRDTRGAVATYPDTRQTNTSATVHDQPRTQSTQGALAPHGAQTKQNTQQLHQSQPANSPGALYQQDIDHPAHTEPRHIVWSLTRLTFNSRLQVLLCNIFLGSK